MTYAELLTAARSLLNDTDNNEFTNAVLLPHLNTARRELQEMFQLNNIPVSNKTSATLDVPSGTAAIGFATTPALPADLIEIRQLWCSQDGQDNWVPMDKLEYLTSEIIPGATEASFFYTWAWMEQEIRLIAANTDLDLKLDYIGSTYVELEEADLSDDVEIINSVSPLQYRTAALASEFIGENPSRSASLNANASNALDRALQISTKGKQAIVIRRRPFRASYKTRARLM